MDITKFLGGIADAHKRAWPRDRARGAGVDGELRFFLTIVRPGSSVAADLILGLSKDEVVAPSACSTSWFDKVAMRSPADPEKAEGAACAAPDCGRFTGRS